MFHSSSIFYFNLVSIGQVLQNDVLAHKSTVEAVNKAGSDLIESSAGEEARGLQNKLENLNQRWKAILEKTEERRQLLDNALLQVRHESRQRPGNPLESKRLNVS